ncbi:hypothetical protein LSUE1_G009423, partial [Lachnellula suecica]
MAAPPEITLKDLTGDWVMNKTLSDDTDPILVLQGVSWFTRKAISLATITLHTKQYTDSDNETHIDIEQTATGGIKGTTEIRVLNWSERTHTDSIFGTVKGRSRWLSGLGEVEKYLQEGWEAGEAEWIESYVVNEKA